MKVQTTLVEEHQRTLDATPLDPFTLAAQRRRLRELGEDGMHSEQRGEGSGRSTP